MEGRFPKTIRIVLTNCTDPSRETEFNKWYDHYLREILATGAARHGIRYVNAEPAEGHATYLVIWESDDELESLDHRYAQVERRLADEGRMHPALQVIRNAVWRRAGPEFTSASTGVVPVRGAFLVESNCTDSSREDEFNRWYETTHIPDFLRTGLFTTAHRFLARPGQPGGKYLAIYETHLDPLSAVNEYSKHHRPRLKAASRLSDLIEVTWRGVYRQLVSLP